MKSKVIICDLDGTLAPSKSPLEPDMAAMICKILEHHKLAVISGGAFQQFEKQFLSHLACTGPILSNLYLFPTNGSICYRFNDEGKIWEVYDERMTKEEREKIIHAFKKAIDESGVDVSNPYGDLVEDRIGQVTFSGRGQNAPLEVKNAWDPDHTKRESIVQILQKLIPEFEIRIGGATSIDVTHAGITKAYAIRKMEEIGNVAQGDILFIGDALFVGGNDASAWETGVECISVSGPTQTLTVLEHML